MEIPAIIQMAATSMAVLVAGAGAYRMTHAAARFFERSELKALQVADVFLETQGKISSAQERQARALETTASLVPVLENINENQRQIGGTLRAMNRKLQELEDLRDQVLSRIAAEPASAGGSADPPQGV